MKLSIFKTHLDNLQSLHFQLPDATFVPAHFHITEVGTVTRNFIDCGGTVRHEQLISFQLWEAEDFDHRLTPEKLKDIIVRSEKVLNIGDHEIEVEYQTSTIGKYALGFNGEHFVLVPKHTACLAEDACSISGKPKIRLSSIGSKVCTPGGSCC